MRFASLGSGSEGNGLLVEADGTRVLIDCGFNLADTCARLERLGVMPETLAAVLVTHEHADHASGVARVAMKYRIPVWLTFGTLTMMGERFANLPALYAINGGEAFEIGGLRIESYPVPHDAREPVQFVCGDGRHRLGILTDAGRITAQVEKSLSGCDALFLECNHDSEMLTRGPYPWSLKQRIAGGYGHLDNQTAAALLTRIDCARLQHLVAGHLSLQNNHPTLAQSALAGALGCTTDWIAIADQAAGLDWRMLA
jgi:phosphoribosyl 1,2-cyclic phosphodiesterase